MLMLIILIYLTHLLFSTAFLTFLMFHSPLMKNFMPSVYFTLISEVLLGEEPKKSRCLSKAAPLAYSKV